MTEAKLEHALDLYRSAVEAVRIARCRIDAAPPTARMRAVDRWQVAEDNRRAAAQALGEAYAQVAS